MTALQSAKISFTGNTHSVSISWHILPNLLQGNRKKIIIIDSNEKTERKTELTSHLI